MRIFLSNPEVEFLNTGSTADLMIRPQRAPSEMVKDAINGKYELIFAGNNAFPYPNPRKSWFKNYANLAWSLLRHPELMTGGRFPYAKLGSRLAAIDLDDRPIIDNRWFGILESCVCYFKRELFQNPCNSFLYTSARTECNGNIMHSEKHRGWIEKLRPISLGVAPDFCKKYSTLAVPKKTDIFFAGFTDNRPNRAAGLRQLRRLADEGFAIDIVEERLPHEEFVRRCAQAYIVWSPEGFGWDCLRHYEAAVTGSVPLMQSPGIRRYAPLMDGEHALYYYIEGDHLAQRIRESLKNRTRLIEMGLSARRHVLKFHTFEALSQYVIDETKRTVAAKDNRQGTGVIEDR